MNDFAQHRAALKRAWADTDFVPLDEPTDMGYKDDLWSDIVRFCTLMYVFAIIFLIFK